MEYLPPVRCYTCGKVLQHKRYEELIARGFTPEQAYIRLGISGPLAAKFNALLEEGLGPGEVINRLGLQRNLSYRICCRRSTGTGTVHVSREVYLDRELSKNILPPPPSLIKGGVSSLPPQ